MEDKMAVAATIVYENSPISTYDEVLPKLFPRGVHDGPGIISHWCEETATGWTVHDVWESEEAMQAFLASRIGPLAIPEPTRVEMTPVHNALRTA
jgi:hypothetical protein